MWKVKLRDWEKVELPVYEFIFKQAEKRLDATIDQSEKITSRVYTVIGTLIPFLALCVGILSKKIQENTNTSFTVVVAAVSLAILVICLFYYIKLIQKRNTWHAGTEPKDALLSEYVEVESFTKEEQVKYLYLSEIEQMQHKITMNYNSNAYRIRIFSMCLRIIVISATISILSIIAMSFIF